MAGNSILTQVQRDSLFTNILGGKASGTSGISSTPEEIKILAVNPALWQTVEERREVRAGLMLFLFQRHPIGGTGHATSWILSLLCAAFPEMYGILNKASNGVAIKQMYLTKADGDGLRGERVYTRTTVVTPGIPAKDGNPAVAAVTTTTTETGAVPFKLDKVYGAYYNEEEVPAYNPDVAQWWELIGALGIILYCLAKPPTPKNYETFVTQRPRNVENTAGATITPEGVLTATLFPPSEALNAVRGGLNLRPKLRRALVAELITWTAMPISPDTELVAVTLRLWAGSAMGHVDLLRNFIINYCDFLLEIPGLYGETQKFVLEYSQLVNNKATDFAYIGVAEGSQRDTLRSRDFIQLTALARDITARTIASWAAYAPNLPPSTFVSMLSMEMEKSGKSLPPVSGTSKTST